MTAVRPVTVTPSALLAAHAANPQRYPALFESAAAGAATGRFDILFACPGARLTLHADQRLTDENGSQCQGTFLNALDRWWSQERLAAASQELPFTGGWLIYLSYELAGQIDRKSVV